MWRKQILFAVAVVIWAAAAQAWAGEYELIIDEGQVSFTGQPRTAMAINGTIPGPTLRFREGEDVTIRVTNRLEVPTSIHWHGVLVPPEMDGVPGISFNGIPAGETFTYRFKLKQSGTYWYHSHSAAQEQSGVYGPLIIEPAQPETYPYDRDYVVMLSDWTDEDPDRVLNNLKKQGGYYNFQRRTLPELVREAREKGWDAAVGERLAWRRMRMDPTDIADVTGATYTFLVNGKPAEANWTALFKPGERVRLRLINGAAMTYFDFRIPGLKMTVVAADGQDIQPAEVDEIRLAVAETYDVIVEPQDEQAYTLFAEAMDRSGYTRGTLAPRPGMSAAIPARRERPLRTMADMGMDHGAMGQDSMPGMDHGTSGEKPPAASGDMGGMEHGGQNTQAPNTTRKPPREPDMKGMEHGSSRATPPAAGGDMAGMDHGGKQPPAQGDRVNQVAPKGHDMAGLKHGAAKPPAEGRDTAAGMEHGSSGVKPPAAGGDMAGMDHGASPTPGEEPVFRHGPDTHGPGNSMVAMTARSRLHEPGVGLGEDGRRVLTYSDLRSLEPREVPPPDLEIEMHLTGNMERFIWGIDGKKFTEAAPVPLRYGSRVRITMINDTMMDHPMHLHGMWMELVNGAGAHQPRKHTINVKPGERLSFDVNVDALGAWAFHCHLLYHMEAGMFRKIVVSEDAKEEKNEQY